MTKSTPKPHDPLKLADVTTYQSGVVQSTAMRKLNRFIAGFMSEYDLTTMEWFVIGTVLDAGDDGMSLTALKNKLGTTMPFITISVKTLLAKDILIKSTHASDGRTKIVAISPHYRATCQKIEKELRGRMKTLFYDHIKPEELRTYVAVLYKISEL